VGPDFSKGVFLNSQIRISRGVEHATAVLNRRPYGCYLQREGQPRRESIGAANVCGIVDANITRRFTVPGLHLEPATYGFDNRQLGSFAELSDNAR
jgi:hypothetical protein